MDVIAWIEKLEKCEILQKDEILMLCSKVKDVFMEENNVVPVYTPVVVVGDVHGQFYDMKTIFTMNGKIPDTNYLFLGDTVDRGAYSMETILLLFCLKLQYPDKLVLVRGNHESRTVNATYGFYEECLKKTGDAQAWRYICDTFDVLPISAIINGKIFCVHGGLSPELRTVDDIREIERFGDVPMDGLYSDLLWSDPEDTPAKHSLSYRPSDRGAGCIYYEDPVKRFTTLNGFNFIVRSHQLAMEGYKCYFNKKVVTVWSAPNYCYVSKNIASVMDLKEVPALPETEHFRTFNPSREDKKHLEIEPPLEYFSLDSSDDGSTI
eukprot:TRINITY_DN5214_c0_g1_i1.p1 TRINITY_DN5214_c0_g1~~TRINITY_DN5214_c0_g1_i1.p1  ORF type:complete len:322 (+),score=64.46 TRINITY_DN5214_c0_g1_i1:149-1114(+)